MKAIKFPQVTTLVAKDQDQYNTLPSYVGPVDSNNTKGVICCFELSNGEIEAIVRNKRLWYRALTFGQPLQPFNIMIMKDYFKEKEIPNTSDDFNIKMLPDGRTIKYLDVVNHETTGIRFSFWNRIKILFGKPINMYSKIYTQHSHCNVSHGETFFTVADLFNKKQKSVSNKP